MADKIIKGLLFDGNVNLIAINGNPGADKGRENQARVIPGLYRGAWAHAYDNVRYGCAAEK